MRIDSLPNGPKNAIPDRELTPEFVSKWDKDLHTIQDLTKEAKKMNCILIVKGGLAVEAQTGGKLTRSHNDIDITFVNSSGQSDNQIFNFVNKVMKAEDTVWELYNKSPEKIEFREKEDDRPFFNRRRLEFIIKKESDLKYEEKELVFSNGHKISVMVTEFYQLIALKTKKLFSVNDDPEHAERDTNVSDYTDLKRMIELPGYNKEKALKMLVEALKNYKNPSSEAVKEYDFVTDLLKEV